MSLSRSYRCRQHCLAGVSVAYLMVVCVGPLVVDGHDAGLCSVAAALRRLTWLAVEVEVLRRRVARAFSVCKRMPRFWKICDWVEFLISPAMHALTLASSEKTATAAGPQAPPSASMTMGMKLMPAAWQSSSVLLCCLLWSSYCVMAAVGSSMVVCTRSLRRPEVTAKSRAARGPERQRGRKTSAGRRASGVWLTPFSGVAPCSGRGRRRPVSQAQGQALRCGTNGKRSSVASCAF